MPTYAPAPRQFKKKSTINAGDEVLCFRKGVQPDEGVRIDASEFGGGGSGPSPANPSVAVGLTAKNGSADTYMRSDAAPALDVAITPTWGGLHIFAVGLKIGGSTANDLFLKKTAADELSLRKGDDSDNANLHVAALTIDGTLQNAPAGNVAWYNDLALTRSINGNLQINSTAQNVGKGLHLPETASDADMPAETAGVVLYSKIVGGKNKLIARFPTGAIQTVASEP